MEESQAASIDVSKSDSSNDDGAKHRRLDDEEESTDEEDVSISEQQLALNLKKLQKEAIFKLYSDEEQRKIARHLRSHRNFMCRCKTGSDQHSYNRFVWHAAKRAEIPSGCVYGLKADVKLILSKGESHGSQPVDFKCPLTACKDEEVMGVSDFNSDLDQHLESNKHLTEGAKELFAFCKNNLDDLIIYRKKTENTKKGHSSK